MAVKFVVTFEGARKTPFVSGYKQRSLRQFVNYVMSLMSGNFRPDGATMTVRNAAVAATGKITFTGLPVADETVTVGNVAFTAKASASLVTEFTIGASANATAVNLAAKINAHTTVSKYVSAAVTATGEITLTALVPGVVGNALQLSEALTNATITAFASGAEDASFTFTA